MEVLLLLFYAMTFRGLMSIIDAESMTAGTTGDLLMAVLLPTSSLCSYSIAIEYCNIAIV